MYHADLLKNSTLLIHRTFLLLCCQTFFESQFAYKATKTLNLAVFSVVCVAIYKDRKWLYNFRYAQIKVSSDALFSWHISNLHSSIVFCYSGVIKCQTFWHSIVETLLTEDNTGLKKAARLKNW